MKWNLQFQGPSHSIQENEEFSMKSAMITTVRDLEDVCCPFAAINAVVPSLLSSLRSVL